MKKQSGFLPIFLVMLASLVIAACWDTFPVIKQTVHSILDPSMGILLSWNLNIGMIIIVYIITLITTLIQKYTTDQKALKELREEQKILQEEMKKYQDNPAKISELSKKQFEFIPRTFKLTSRSVLYTGIPFILFFRWFSDVFIQMGSPKFWFGMGWFLFYFVFSLIFTSILKKYLKTA
jgi:uncharacterized membrane protein (DUF106 family)